MATDDRMTLNDYQQQSQKTDQYSNLDSETGLGMPFMGLIEDAGDLARIYKEIIRNGGKSSDSVNGSLEEKLGDILWYLSNIAQKANLSLGDIAKKNLDLTNDRWNRLSNRPKTNLFDLEYPADQQLPRMLDVHFKKTDIADSQKILMYVKDDHGNEIPLGDRLDDNSYDEDGYRYHDVFHLAYYAILGWSPVIRSLLKRKRKARIDPERDVDKVEDGARAILVEEGLTAYIFQYAKRDNRFFENESTVDTSILKMARLITANLEVKACRLYEWEDAILTGYRIFNQIRRDGAGSVLIDLKQRTIDFKRL